jgi:hypothetical protein
VGSPCSVQFTEDEISFDAGGQQSEFSAASFRISRVTGNWSGTTRFTDTEFVINHRRNASGHCERMNVERQF